jgi:hypothetical protein
VRPSAYWRQGKKQTADQACFLPCSGRSPPFVVPLFMPMPLRLSQAGMRETPKGFCPPVRGWSEKRGPTPGNKFATKTNPNGVADRRIGETLRGRRTQPRWGWAFTHAHAPGWLRCAPRPRAGRRNPFGIRQVRIVSLQNPTIFPILKGIGLKAELQTIRSGSKSGLETETPYGRGLT